MDEHFGCVRISNSTHLCVGGITRAEASHAKEGGMEIDGFGYYLFLSSEAAPTGAIEVIAKVPDVAAAEKLVRLFQIGEIQRS